MFSSLVRDCAFAQAPDTLEVFPREQGKRNVSTNHHQRADDRAPNMEHVHPPEGALRNGRCKVKEQPTRHGQSVHHEDEDEIAHLLATVVTALWRNFHRTKRDTEEAAWVTTKIAEPLDRVHIPGQQSIQQRSKAMRCKH